jgi:hypothetical protein
MEPAMRWPVRKKRGERRLQGKIEAWNRAHVIGEPIKYRDDYGKVIESKTLSEAWVLSGHTAVIKIEGRSGCYDFERIIQAEGKQI